jgi:endonuclease YncB( thermonuclease family)
MARRYCRWPGWSVYLALTLAAVLGVRVWWPNNRAAKPKVVAASFASRTRLQPGRCEILQAIDGHTLLVAQEAQDPPGLRHFRVRLLGVTLPDEPYWKQSAVAELSRIAPPGPAFIECDKRRVAVDGTWLAYVHIGDTLVNANLLLAGVARHEAYPGDSMSIGQSLRRAQADARAHRRGAWNEP